ncbi:MAG: hypothetical protein AAFR93_09100 [Pseudomonadota bacterium]
MSEPPKSAFALLNQLRFVAMRCRVKPRTDLFKACAALHGTRAIERPAYEEVLMRGLGEALGQTPKLLAPGTAETTFDEAWLLQLIQAHASGDTASVRFLLHSRIAAQHRQQVLFLIAHAAAPNA